MLAQQTVAKTAENPNGSENNPTVKDQRTPDGRLHVSFGKIKIRHCTMNDEESNFPALNCLRKVSGMGPFQSL